MARIRTIKPEIPHSESLGKLSRDARLTFILMWTIADDSGRLRGNSRMLASLLFPYDDDAIKKMDGWLADLAKQDCIIRYCIDGQSYIQICNWLIHQRIDKPTPSKIPLFENPLGVLCDSSQIFHVGKEGKGEEWKGVEAVSEPPNCPHVDIVKIYHEVLPMMTSVREWTDDRKEFLKTRWREKDERQNLDWWRDYFIYVSKSDFLCGRVEGRNGKPPFQADLEWLVRPSNFVKVIEGKYENKGVAA